MSHTFGSETIEISLARAANMTPDCFGSKQENEFRQSAYANNSSRHAAGTMTTALVLSSGDRRERMLVLDWNAIMQSTVSGQAPFPQARFAAITQLAVFEAVNAIRKDYKPYLGTIRHRRTHRPKRQRWRPRIRC